MAEIEVHNEKGTKELVETTLLVKFRRVTESEKEKHPNANAQLVYDGLYYVREEAERVAELVTAASDNEEKKLLGKLTLPNKWPVWFRGPSASGPVRIPPSLREDGVQSALEIGGKIQFVRETPRQVYELLKAVNGKYKPPLESEVFSTTEATTFEQSLSADSVWDFEVPELRVAPKLVDR